MIKYENECVSCGLPCLGVSCPYREVAHYYCDCCGGEGKLYHYDNKELCEECLLKNFEVVEGSDW
jgi:hypothetical protein